MDEAITVIKALSLIDYALWGSYTGEKYQANLLLSLNHQKVAENGGITNDAYITHPDMFNESFETNENSNSLNTKLE